MLRTSSYSHLWQTKKELGHIALFKLLTVSDILQCEDSQDQSPGMLNGFSWLPGDSGFLILHWIIPKGQSIQLLGTAILEAESFTYAFWFMPGHRHDFKDMNEFTSAIFYYDMLLLLIYWTKQPKYFSVKFAVIHLQRH